ncbi:hypothetical protein [Urbifossiella limnaea]|uniref:Uncharacterized protein n=1 Tax=Urbifossiella limnaea TaxID=2528023 RepID=A0A517XXS3_9BACT|nr:hypothetical protein [Urbifossiella limnaea]QDU22296.1 hypothetical protein ETAA1_42740 [Urbifossiella limnaea]
MPTRRPDDDDDYDDPPRRDDRDDPDDRPRRRRRPADDRPAAKSGGGVGKILLILLLIGGGGMALCCGGCGVMLYLASGRQVTMVDGSRTKSPQGGTQSVTVKVLMSGENPGGFFKGDFYFNFRSGSRTSSHDRTLKAFGGGQGPAEYRETFITPELANEPGPVEFWVERRDGNSVSKVSPTYTIP